jgi:glycosyltransferase involved in cell wall biosynthesis
VHSQLDALKRDLALDVLAAGVAREFEAVGIPSILLKGASIARWLYQEEGSRHYSDVDLLVGPGGYDMAAQVLQEMGFADPVALARSSEGQANARAWRRADGMVVDLHRALIGIGASPEVAFAALQRHTTALSVGGRDVKVLDVAARGLHLALHAAQHGIDHPVPLQDLALALEQLAAAVWEEVALLAEELDAVAAFGAGLRLLPDGRDLAARLRLPVDTPVATALRAMSASELSLGFERLAHAGEVPARLRYVAGKLVPSAAFLRSWTPLANRGRTGLWLARLWRPLWLIFHSGPAYLTWRRATRVQGTPPKHVTPAPPLSDPSDPAKLGVSDLRVLRVYHSGVVSEWRQRDRFLRSYGTDLTLVTARRWNEGGANVAFDNNGDSFVVPVSTLGRHPNVFLYNPLPLWRLLRRGRFDLLDVHEEPCSLAVAEVNLLRMLASPRSRLIVYSGQNLYKRYPVPFRWLEQVALRRSAALYVCAADAASVMRRKGFRGRVCILPLGVDRDRYRPCEPSDTASTGRRMRIGFVGRIDRRKGVFVLLDAIADEPEWSLTLAGEGPDVAEMNAAIREMGLAERVTFAGYVDRPQLPDFYRSVDVVVVPSQPTRGWVEQFGRVVAEAMASGRPVVATNTGALPEVVGDAGLLVPPGDASALRWLLLQLAANPGLRAELAAAGLARSARWSWPAVAQQQLTLYRQVLGQH